MAAIELVKLVRDPTEMVSRAVQPVLWLTLFGQVMSKVHALPTGPIGYLAFITPGILAQSVLFSAIFYGIAVIWERDLGVVHKLLATPASRLSLVLGKALAAGFRGLVQAAVIYFVAWALQVSVRHDPLAILATLGAVLLGSAILSTFSLVVACIVKTRERFMGIGQVLTMPLFFASNALYPVDLMPAWLGVVARFNPLTYLVDALRGLMIDPQSCRYGYPTDFGLLAAALVVMLAIATRRYPSLAY